MAETQAPRRLPSIIERDPRYDYHVSDPYSRLLRDRVVLLCCPVDDTAAADVMAQLIYLDGESDRPISLYLNSPGGSLTAMMAVYDTMRYLGSEIRTVCLGQAVSAAAVLLAAGTHGKRLILPYARVILHEPDLPPAQGPSDDLQIQARETLRLRAVMTDLLVQHTGQPGERIDADLSRQTSLPAEQAVASGLADEIITRLDGPGRREA